MSVRIAAVAASLVLLGTGTAAPAFAAAPVHATPFDPLEPLAARAEAAAKRADWGAARLDTQRLDAKWVSVRASAQRSLRGKANAQRLDASLKWLSSAIERKDAAEVHKAVASVTTAVHELQERAGRNTA
jgi:hypothetical protein